MAKEIQKFRMEGSKMRANKPGLGTPVMNGKVRTLQSVVQQPCQRLAETQRGLPSQKNCDEAESGREEVWASFTGFFV